MPFIHSPADGPDHVEVAALLVAMAEEAGIHTREILVSPHGFHVPDALYDQLNPALAVAMVDPRDEGKTPPPGWDEPLADDVNVERLEDGKFYLIEDDPAEVKTPLDAVDERLSDAGLINLKPNPTVKHAEIRDWATEQGLKVSAKGKLPQDVIDAFYAAHSAE